MHVIKMLWKDTLPPAIHPAIVRWGIACIVAGAAVAGMPVAGRYGSPAAAAEGAAAGQKAFRRLAPGGGGPWGFAGDGVLGDRGGFSAEALRRCPPAAGARAVAAAGAEGGAGAERRPPAGGGGTGGDNA